MAIQIKNCAYAQDAEQVSIDERNRGTYQVSWLIEVEDDAGGDGFAVGGQEVLNKAVRIASPPPTPHPLPYLGDPYAYYNDAASFRFARNFQIARHSERRDWLRSRIGRSSLASPIQITLIWTPCCGPPRGIGTVKRLRHPCRRATGSRPTRAATPKMNR